MKKGMGLNEMIIELERQQKAKEDYIAPAKGMMMMEDGNTFKIRHLNTGEIQEFESTSVLHRQIGGTLKIPAKYYDLMREEKPELLARNINSWFEDRTDQLMLRSFQYPENSVGRALLSVQYRRIDNLLIAETILPMFAGDPQFEVVSCEVTERRMYLQIVNQRLTGEVNVGDVVQGGVFISNSEVGQGAVTVQPFLYRLQCTNGMVVKEMGERRTHIGRQQYAIENSFEILSTEAMEAEDKALALRLRDLAKVAIEENMFKGVLKRLKASTKEELDGDPGDVVKLASKVYDFTSTEQTGILRHLVEGGELSKYGLANAITRTSTDVEDYDRAVDLEMAGWQVATMDQQLWKQLNGKAYMI